MVPAVVAPVTVMVPVADPLTQKFVIASTVADEPGGGGASFCCWWLLAAYATGFVDAL